MGASARPPRDCNGARIEPFLDPGYIRVVKQVAKRSAVPLVDKENADKENAAQHNIDMLVQEGRKRPIGKKGSVVHLSDQISHVPLEAKHGNAAR